MSTNTYRGGAGLVIQWLTAGGTQTLNTTYSKFDVDRSIDLVDTSSGNDQDKTYITGLKDGTASLSWLDTGASGSALANSLSEGTSGTLVYFPQGTTAGKPKRGFVAFSKGVKESYPFDNKVEYSCTFQKTGAMVYDYNAVAP